MVVRGFFMYVLCGIGLVLAGPAFSANPPAPAAKAVDASAFPLRPQYIDVPIITTADLDRKFDSVVIVDVRSRYEFETLRVKGAVNIPVSSRKFSDEVEALQKQNPSKPLVFYCNGKTCRKSYDAVLKAKAARIDGELICYDAGIADWAEAHPEKSALLGRSPIKPGELLSKDRFKERLLDPKAFESKVGPDAIVLDVRDRVQRDTQLFPLKEQRAQLNETAKLDAVIDQAKRERKTLLVYDAVGKQVEWFQYYLENRGLKDYYFMKGGSQGYFDAKYGKIKFERAKSDKSTDKQATTK